MTTAGGLGRAPLLPRPGSPLFVVLCTLNSAGYRYGASDQAFYAPAVIQRAPSRLLSARRAADRRPGAADRRGRSHRRAGRAPPACRCRRAFALLYAGGLVLFALGVAALGERCSRLAARHPDTARRADAAARHRRDRHQHARRLFPSAPDRVRLRRLGGRRASCAADSCRSSCCWRRPALIHPTTALWFIVWLTVAAIAADRRLMRAGRRRRGARRGCRRLGADRVGRSPAGSARWTPSGSQRSAPRPTCFRWTGAGACG